MKMVKNKCLIFKKLLKSRLPQQLYKQNNRILMMDQSASFPFLGFFPFGPHFSESLALPPIDFQRITALLEQNSRVIAENRSLTSQLASLSVQNKKLKSQNTELKRQQDNQFRLEKRKYTPRRKELEKNYVCNVDDCTKSYSSIIALRNHERGVHKLTVREKKCQP